MNDDIKNQVYGVFDKYDKTYCNSGVMANIQEWKNNKSWLVELLRRHPSWNEDALAVVFEVTHSREIDKSKVNLHRHGLSRLISELEMTEDNRNKFIQSLDAVALTYAKTLPGTDTAALVKDYCGVTCVAGQKTSRIINAICKKYALDKHPDYNACFAKLADSLNPMQIKRTALLSVHPCDYLEMSNKHNSWSSCHCLAGGEYHGGTLSYMNDECSMIFYTVDDDVTEGFYTAPKRTRQVFCFNNGILLQSRLYPQTDDSETRDIYRNIVQRAVADCMGIPNLWTLKREQDEVNQRVRTHEDALNYRDYEYKCNKPNISLLKNHNISEDDYMLVGSTAYCIDCSEPIYENNGLYCESCSDDDCVSCYGCDHSVYEDDAHNIGGYWYCNECCSYCDHCEEYTSGEVTDAYNRRGHRISVCDYCRDEYYYYCEDCDDYYNEDNGRHLDDGFSCNECFDSNYCACDSCGEYIRIEDMEAIDYASYCESCAGKTREEEVIADAGYLMSA